MKTLQSPYERNAHRRDLDEPERDPQIVESRRKYYGAWRSWLRKGLNPSVTGPGLSPEEKRIYMAVRDLGTGGLGAYPGVTNTTGAGFVPLEFQDRVSSALKFYGPMLDRDFVTVDDTPTGSPKGYPEDNDTTISGMQVPEQIQESAEDISGLDAVYLKSFKYSSNIVKCSAELVQDTGFDLESYLVSRFAIRIARVLNPLLTTGAGTTQPFGVVGQASVGATAIGAGTNDGVSNANTIGTDDLASLEASVDPAYRMNARFMVHPNTLAALRKVKDKQGRPVFPDLHGGGENRIMNYPVVLNPAMDQLQSVVGSPPVTRNTVIFGDHSKYVVRRAPPVVTRMDERFIDFGQLAFVMIWRVDGALIDGGGGAVKLLTNTY